MLLFKTVATWCHDHPLIKELIALRKTSWFNPRIVPAAGALADVGLTADEVVDAGARLL